MFLKTYIFYSEKSFRLSYSDTDLVALFPMENSGTCYWIFMYVAKSSLTSHTIYTMPKSTDVMDFNVYNDGTDEFLYAMSHSTDGAKSEFLVVSTFINSHT